MTNVYPTLEEIKNACPTRILQNYRFLPSPTNETEVVSNNALYDRYIELKKSDEINSNTSKSVGW